MKVDVVFGDLCYKDDGVCFYDGKTRFPYSSLKRETDHMSPGNLIRFNDVSYVIVNIAIESSSLITMWVRLLKPSVC